MAKEPAYRAAVDIGGTFTDVVVAASDGRLACHKLLSTPADYGQAALEGILAALARLGLEPGSRAEVLHATTVATNAILERAGASCALITTEGFRDVLEIGRLRMPRLYDIFYDKPRPLIPRRLVFEVRERIDHRGNVLTALDAATVEAAVAAVAAAGVGSVAVSLINAYANPAHERAVAAALAARAPGIDVSLSSAILPRIGEYERTSTTAVNAYVQPVVRGYLEGFRRRLGKAGIRAPLFIMHSGGGLTTDEGAVARPVGLVESGPAAGVLAAGTVIGPFAGGNVLSFDMGGTSAKASIIEKGRVLRTGDYEVGGAISATTRLTGGGGYPIAMPVVDVAEVGAGGGSIAWRDAGGGLRVGPVSAGAQPGPACYGRGGEAPTVTDADVVLGYLDPEALAGGALPIDAEAAARAIRDRVAGPLRLDLHEAARGIHLIANSEMMGAIRAVSTQRGRDVRDFALAAFGGSGPVHAVELAREAGIGTVIVPLSPGVFSAYGLLTQDLEFQEGRTFYADVATLDPALLAAALEELKRRVAAMAGDAVGPDGLAFDVEADLHYWGQSHDLTVRVPSRVGDAGLPAALKVAFEAEHERTYGHRAEAENVILVTARVIGRAGPTPAAGGRNGGVSAGSPGRVRGRQGRRRAYFGAGVGFADCAVVARHHLDDRPRPGPLLIEDYDSTTVVPPGASVRRAAEGHLVIDAGRAGRAEAA